jgi:hypothetical protein
MPAECSTRSKKTTIPSHRGLVLLVPSPLRSRVAKVMGASAATSGRLERLEVSNTYPEPETEKERSPIDFPQARLVPSPLLSSPRHSLGGHTRQVLPPLLRSFISSHTLSFPAGVDHPTAEPQARYLPGIRKAGDATAEAAAWRPGGAPRAAIIFIPFFSHRLTIQATKPNKHTYTSHAPLCPAAS